MTELTLIYALTGIIAVVILFILTAAVDAVWRS